MHKSNIEENSILEELYGTDLVVSSMHHQSIDIIGDNLHVIQKSPDGTIEAIQHEILPILGVQWHPEKMGENGEILFKKFLSICEQKRKN